MLACAAAPCSAARPLGAQPPPTTGALPSTRAVRAQIDVAQTSYRAGDTVAVRLTFTNTGAVPLYVIAAPPWRAARLIVTDSHGQVFAPVDDARDDRSYHSGRTYTLSPQTPDTAVYKGQQWTGLQHWGYSPLPPGQYTLTVVPLVTSAYVDLDAVTVRSNQVTITITPLAAARR